MKSCQWPVLLDSRGQMVPEIALAGRSNVGKSTLVNMLARQKKLAFVSTRPGKTQCLQFFAIGKRALLVDLPGYGFAAAPSSVQNGWSLAVDEYLNQRTSLKKLYILLDIRRDPSNDDRRLFEWAASRPLICLPVFTKNDLLTKEESGARREKIISTLGLPKKFLALPAPRRVIWHELVGAL